MSAHGSPDGLDVAIDDVARELTAGAVDIRPGVAGRLRRRDSTRWWIVVPAAAIGSTAIVLMLTQRPTQLIDLDREGAAPAMRTVEPLTIERLEVPVLVVEPLGIETLNAG